MESVDQLLVCFLLNSLHVNLHFVLIRTSCLSFIRASLTWIIPLILKVAPQNCEGSRRDSIATQGSVEGGLEATKDFGEKESSDYINPQGIRFTSQMTSSSNDLRGFTLEIIYFIR